MAQFLYARSKEVVLQTAQNLKSLQYKGAKVLVLLDLPPDVLWKRKSLKPITDHLKAKDVRFQWSAALDVVVRDGTQYKADDIALGHTLLAALDPTTTYLISF